MQSVYDEVAMYEESSLTFPVLSTPEKALLASCTTPLGSSRTVPVVGLTSAGRERGTSGSTVRLTANTSGTPWGERGVACIAKCQTMHIHIK